MPSFTYIGYSNIHKLIFLTFGTGVIDQWLRALAVLVEDPNSADSTHIGPSNCNDLFWLLWHREHVWFPDIHADKALIHI